MTAQLAAASVGTLTTRNDHNVMDENENVMFNQWITEVMFADIGKGVKTLTTWCKIYM